VFDRAIPIRHAAIILPAGYQLTECNVPAQVLADPDGRIRVSFMYQAPGAAPLILKARPGAPTGDAARPRPLTNARTWESMPAQGPTERARLSERARQDRDIVYFLQEPFDECLQPVPRLHRVARRHRQVSQRGADRQHGVQYVRENPRHRARRSRPRRSPARR
jgi:hypothetical protein